MKKASFLPPELKVVSDDTHLKRREERGGRKVVLTQQRYRSCVALPGSKEICGELRTGSWSCT